MDYDEVRVCGATTDKPRSPFLPLLPHASYRRSALQEMYRKMEEEIENLTKQIAEQAEQRARARRLMTHPGVGPVTALATEVFLGDPGAVRGWQGAGQLGGDHPEGVLQWRKPAARWNHETRQSAVAVSLV
jgi:hypothetical protein